MSESFSITVSSKFSELWRYNIAIVCQCFDDAGEAVEVCSENRHIADVGANLKGIPEGCDNACQVELHTPSCDNVEALIYLIPHTLPTNKVVEDSEPFALNIKIVKGAATLYDWVHQVNQWAGASISLKA